MLHSLTSGPRRLISSCLLLIVLAAMGGCASETGRQTPPAPEAEPEGTAEPIAPEDAQEVRRDWRQEQVEKLLNKADAALADYRLTLPEHDNAYDRYAAALLLDPDNQRARAGLESVLLAYVELIRNALRDNQLARARQLQAQASQYYGNNPLLRETEKAIADAETRQRQLQLKRQQTGERPQGQEFELPPADLSRKSEEVVQLLARLGERVQETDESVLIMARTDAEGRWIYKQMNEAVPDYRIRGDIRVTSKPAVRLLPPL